MARVNQYHLEDDVRKGILFALGALMLLAGCNSGADKSAGIPVNTWKGQPYRLTFDAPPAKPNPAGVTIPTIKYTANPDALVMRAAVVVRFDSAAVPKKLQDKLILNQVVLAPVSVKDPTGAFPPDYMDFMDKEVAKLLEMYCINGKVKLTVVVARASMNSRPSAEEIEDHRLSDWQPVEVDFKNPHPKC